MANEDVSVEKKIEKEALEYFSEYFRQNYPGPNTIIHNPNWHAPKIFRAAQWALKQARSGALKQARSDNQTALDGVTK
jgi:hypothetical protein